MLAAVARSSVVREPVVDGWYSWITDLPAFTDWLESISPRLLQASWRSGVLRGILLFAAGTRRDVIGVIYHDRGWRTLFALRAVFGRRPKLVVFHLLTQERRKEGLGRWVDDAWERVEVATARRTIASAQVLSDWERDLQARRLRLPVERLSFIPFPRRTKRDATLRAPADGGQVVSIGCALCDWSTVFQAAAGTSWPLVVVCAADDHEEVQRLNSDGRATVMVDIPADDAAALLESATLSVVAMRDGARSQGHVRLKDAADAGVAVVATETRGLLDYVRDGETALLVAPGDPAGLRSAIDGLLGDPEAREQLRRAAFERSQEWTFAQYTAAIEALVRGRPPQVPV